jgi:hypothetical protein
MLASSLRPSFGFLAFVSGLKADYDLMWKESYMDRYAYELWDPQKVKAGVEELKHKSNADIITITVAADKGCAPERSLQSFLSDGSDVRADTIRPVTQYLCDKLDASEERFRVSDAAGFGIYAVLAARALRIAAYHAADAALEAVRNLRARVLYAQTRASWVLLMKLVKSTAPQLERLRMS